MEIEPDHQKSLNQRILKCVGISVVIGLAAGQLFDSADLGNPAARSLTGYGAIADLALIAVAILVVLGSIQMILVLRSGTLIFLGTAVIVIALAGPIGFTRILPGRQIHPGAPSSLLISTTLEFIGALFLGTGLQRLLWRKGHTAREETYTREE